MKGLVLIAWLFGAHAKLGGQCRGPASDGVPRACYIAALPEFVTLAGTKDHNSNACDFAHAIMNLGFTQNDRDRWRAIFRAAVAKHLFPGVFAIYGPAPNWR